MSTWPTSCSRILHEKLIVPQLCIKLTTFYEIRVFITLFKTASHWPLLSKMITVHKLTFHFFTINFNIIFEPNVGLLKRLLFLRFRPPPPPQKKETLRTPDHKRTRTLQNVTILCSRCHLARKIQKPNFRHIFIIQFCSRLLC